MLQGRAELCWQFFERLEENELTVQDPTPAA